MNKIDFYRQQLRAARNVEALLLAESGLPGPRGNLELAQACVEELPARTLRAYLKYTPQRAPTNAPHEFLAFCGTLGLGIRAARGDERAWRGLRLLAGDPRWRIREAVAMALQRVGRSDMGMLMAHLQTWRSGSPLVQRAVAAGLCEPDLLRRKGDVVRTLNILAGLSAPFKRAAGRVDPERLVLRQALGYCWSVAIAAHPQAGKRAFEKLLPPASPDLLWIVKENLSKNRLTRMDPAWVADCRRRIAAGNARPAGPPKRSR
ncbi:MAG: hypothetical protein NTY23_10615 [Chloroflexi bacterium]|nr:hypothetical protein [Chloroflexota bacterium]